MYYYYFNENDILVKFDDITDLQTNFGSRIPNVYVLVTSEKRTYRFNIGVQGISDNYSVTTIKEKYFTIQCNIQTIMENLNLCVEMFDSYIYG